MVFGEVAYTKKIQNTTFTITSDMGLTSIGLILVSGTATISGGNQNGLSSETLNLIYGVTIPITAKRPCVLRDITITVTSGIVYLIGIF